jgi:NitT/TauT family transport system substrate-binding protein
MTRDYTNTSKFTSARCWAIAAIASLLAIAGGCDRGGKSASVAAPTKVKIGYVGLTCDADLFVAYEKGFFKDEGLDVEMIKMPWPDLREALSLGKIDATHHLVMFLLKPIEGGVNIRLTAGVHKGCLRVQALASSDIKTVKDLKGKRIAVPGMGTPPYMFAQRALLAAGLDPNKDVDWKVFPPADAELALDRGLVDAVGDSEPIGTMLLSKNKVRNIADQATDAPYKDEYCCAVVVSGKLCQESPETAAKITRAILRGSKWTNANPTAAAELAVEKKYVASTKELNAAAISKLSYMPSVSGGKAAVISASAEMKQIGFLKPTTSPEELAKTAFAPLPGVTDEWINNLQVEKVAGGGPTTEAQLAAAIAAGANVKNVKTCCTSSANAAPAGAVIAVGGAGK